MYDPTEHEPRGPAFDRGGKAIYNKSWLGHPGDPYAGCGFDSEGLAQAFYNSAAFRPPEAGYGFEYYYSALTRSDGSTYFARNGVEVFSVSVNTSGFYNFFTDMQNTFNDKDFTLSFESAYGNLWVVGNSAITNQKSSFAGINSLNFMSFQEAKIYGLTSSGKGETFYVDAAIQYLNENAYPYYIKEKCGYCARSVRLAIEAGGINTANHPGSAKDYTPYLTGWGFEPVSPNNYIAMPGDIRVIQPYPGGSQHGHIDMYNGFSWVSDFIENGFWPGPGYRTNQPSYTIFRW